jgi:UDP-N-acetylglucosamine 2-epimerase (non-hydrolysing)
LHPPTKKQIEKQGLENELKKNQNIELRPRYDYFEFIKLINNSEFVISDGGSNQEECYYLGKPCLLLRNKTERNEGLGENVVLSKFNDEVIEDFTKNYKKFRTKMITKKGSPSKVIVKKTERFKGRK